MLKFWGIFLYVTCCIVIIVTTLYFLQNPSHDTPKPPIPPRPTPSSGRNYKIMLYQGAVPRGAQQNKDMYLKYQRDMIKFAVLHKLDRIFMDISSPSIYTAQDITTLAEVLSNVPGNVQVGAVLEAIPTGDFKLSDEDLEKYFNGEDISKTTPGGINPDPSTWVVPDIGDSNSCISYIRDNSKKADAECIQNCGSSSYCNPNGTCHGCPNVSCAFPKNPSGCPNQLQVAFRFLAKVNEVARQKGAKSFFSSVIVDKENVSSPDKENYAADLFLYVNSALKYLVNDYVPHVEIGQAGQGSMTPQSLMSAGVKYCKKFGDTDYCNSLTNLPDSISIITYPEFYWYGELKPKGCVGCPQTLENVKDQLGATGVDVIKNSDLCSGCEDIKQYLKYYTPENMNMNNVCQNGVCTASGAVCNPDKHCGVFTLYDKCIQSGCNEICCKSIGCVPCKYNETGGSPNTAVIYQKNANNPDGLLEDLDTYANINTYVKDISSKGLNVCPMFSNEISHDWNMDYNGKRYSISGQGTDVENTCVTRKYGNDTCGTFDGFGNWTWDAFEQFLTKFTEKHGLKQIGIYEWQFVPPEWLEGIDNIILPNS